MNDIPFNDPATGGGGLNENVVRLNIGGTEAKDGWKILNVAEGRYVDYVGDCIDLGQFADGSVESIYASHVYEHLSHAGELQQALREAHRVLRPGGLLQISVPDFELLARMFLHPTIDVEQRYLIMQVIFGGQTDRTDFHKVGLTLEFISYFLHQAGFERIRRVPEFGLFNDCSTVRILGQLISLNVEVIK